MTDPIQDLAMSIQRMKMEPWVKQWWGEYQRKLDASPLRVMTMTFCIKPTRGILMPFIARLKALPFVTVPAAVVASEDQKPRRGRKRKIKKPFPNLTATLKISLPEGVVTLKMFKNSSMQACGCKSWNQMMMMCRIIEERLDDGCLIRSVDVNNSSLCDNILWQHPEYIPEGQRMSLSQISDELNLTKPTEMGEWEENSLHGQARQTNLNLWWRDTIGGRHYASVYPRGTIRLTTTNIDMAIHMHASLVSVIHSLHSRDQLTCIDTTAPLKICHPKLISTLPCTSTAVDTGFFA